VTLSDLDQQLWMRCTIYSESLIFARAVQSTSLISQKMASAHRVLDVLLSPQRILSKFNDFVQVTSNVNTVFSNPFSYFYLDVNF
jgi:hypothetical protein